MNVLIKTLSNEVKFGLKQKVSSGTIAGKVGVLSVYFTDGCFAGSIPSDVGIMGLSLSNSCNSKFTLLDFIKVS